MKILHIKTGSMKVNTFILFRPETKECVLIDPGADPEQIEERMKEFGLSCSAVLLTHGHFDHIGAVRYFQSGGATVLIHERDAEMLRDNQLCLGTMAGVTIPPCTADILLHGGETLKLAGLEIRVLATPGHTPGGACYLAGHNIFSGDTLFRNGVGRTDFPGGDTAQLRCSIVDVLFTLDEDYDVYPGHDAFTTLFYEREYNPEFGRNGDVYGF